VTRIEKSDAQLDAEAAAPLTPLEKLIKKHRESWEDDNDLRRLVSRQPPMTRYEKSDDRIYEEPKKWAGPLLDHLSPIEEQREKARRQGVRYGADDEYVIESGDAVGMSMSGTLLRRLSERPGEPFPWVTALYELRYWCRRNHPYHRDASRPYWRGSLCHSLVRLTVIGADKGNYGPLSIEEAGKVLRYDNPEPVLRLALERIEETIDRRQRDAIAREAMLEKHVRPVNSPDTELATPHHLGPWHELDCAKCAKENAA
jgi:hypothetical protein